MSPVLNKEDIPKAFLYPKSLLTPALFSTEVFTITFSPRPHHVLSVSLPSVLILAHNRALLPQPCHFTVDSDQSCLLASGIQLLAFLFSL